MSLKTCRRLIDKSIALQCRLLRHSSLCLFSIILFLTHPAAGQSLSTTNLRLLLDYYHGGEILAGAFSRASFESHFEFVGYNNKKPVLADLQAYDVVVTKLAAPLEADVVSIFQQYLAGGGGLIVIRNWEAFGLACQLTRLDATAKCDGNIYRGTGGFLREYDSAGCCAVGGVLNSAFEAFKSAVMSVGSGRKGSRAITPLTYYGTDLTIGSAADRVLMVCEAERCPQYQALDLPALQIVLSRMEQFVGFSIGRRITAIIRPTALEYGIFVYGVTNAVDTTVHARPPGHVAGIFAHEAGHIIGEEFDRRFIPLAGFGEGVLQNVGDGRMAPDFTSSAVNGMWLQGARSIWLWYHFIGLHGPENMGRLFNSLPVSMKAYIPTHDYWNALYAGANGDEVGTLYLQRAASVTNYYFSKAWGVNYTNQVREWGFAQVRDWAPYEEAVLRGESCYAGAGYPAAKAAVRATMLTSFYGGDFDTASLNAAALCSGASPTLGVTLSHSGDFVQNQRNAYRIVVSNSVGAPVTAGRITVTAIPPSGLFLTSLNGGPEWDCSVLPTCSSTKAITPGGSLPPIVMTVHVAGNAPASLTNSVSVSGGAAFPVQARDPTTILSDGCDTTFPTAGLTAPADGVTRTLTLTPSPSGCRWSAAATASWLQVFPLEGDSGQLTYTVFPNFSTLSRQATLLIDGKPLRLIQAGNTRSYARRFVSLMYFSFFGRIPSVSESTYMENALAAGLPSVDFVWNFLQSEEFSMGGRFIAGLYEGILNRPAEYGGWLFIRNALSTAKVLHGDLIRNFLESDEFKLNHPILSNREFAALMYRQVLLREGTVSELDFMQSVLDQSKLTRSAFALNFLQSAEFRIGTGPALSSLLLYACLLQRGPNLIEFTTTRTRIAEGTSIKTMISEIMTSAEFSAVLR